MPKRHLIEQQYYGPGIRAYLACDEAQCKFDVGVERTSQGLYHAVRVCVAWQPRGNDGMACGPPMCWLEQRLALHGLAGDSWSWGCLRLPSMFRATVARGCYFLVQPE